MVLETSLWRPFLGREGYKKELWWKRESKNRTPAPHNNIYKTTKILIQTVVEWGGGEEGGPHMWHRQKESFSHFLKDSHYAVCVSENKIHHKNPAGICLMSKITEDDIKCITFMQAQSAL